MVQLFFLSLSLSTSFSSLHSAMTKLFKSIQTEKLIYSSILPSRFKRQTERQFVEFFDAKLNKIWALHRSFLPSNVVNSELGNWFDDLPCNHFHKSNCYCYNTLGYLTSPPKRVLPSLVSFFFYHLPHFNPEEMWQNLVIREILMNFLQDRKINFYTSDRTFLKAARLIDWDDYCQHFIDFSFRVHPRREKSLKCFDAFHNLHKM